MQSIWSDLVGPRTSAPSHSWKKLQAPAAQHPGPPAKSTTCTAACLDYRVSSGQDMCEVEGNPFPLNDTSPSILVWEWACPSSQGDGILRAMDWWWVEKNTWQIDSHETWPMNHESSPARFAYAVASSTLNLDHRQHKYCTMHIG